MNCPNCGAVIKEGQFCNYCGAKLPDDTKRIEVKIDKRIEDVAEIKRAEYEEKESKLRQRKMAKDLRKGKARWIVICIFLFLALLSHFFYSSYVSVVILVGIFCYLLISFLR